ncbi:MAG: hypothetical protein ACRDNK_05355, partial [Solirubrobacteraceae bacterium]
MRDTADLIAADRRFVWHPFTQQQGWHDDEEPLVIDTAQGTNLFDREGNAYIDGVSSLWCNVHGHPRRPASRPPAKRAGRAGSVAATHRVSQQDREASRCEERSCHGFRCTPSTTRRRSPGRRWKRYSDGWG